jgi:hypothetical protein
VDYILTSLLAAAILGTGLFIGLSIAFFSVKRSILRTFRAYFTSPKEGDPSQAGLILDVIAQLFAQKIVQNFKNVVGGMNSKDNEAARQLEMTALKQGSPGAAALINMLPKRWQKNADLVKLAAAFLGTPRGNGSRQDQGEPTRRTPFNL